MTTPTSPPDLPSASALRRASLVALLVATALCVTAVLPAEYGIDPTGIGARLGLTQMGRLKQELAKEAIEAARADSAAAAQP